MKKIILITGLLSIYILSYGGSPSPWNQNYIIKNVRNGTDASSNVHIIKYFDGLGRPIQTVTQAASSSGWDIVTPIVYDNMGRADTRQYLPYVATNINNGYYNSDAEAQQSAYYNSLYNPGDPNSPIILNDGDFAYRQNIYEASPMNRVLESYNVGKVFHDSAKCVHYGYHVNEVNEVLKVKSITAGGFTVEGYCPKSTLFKHVVTNEDGMTSVTYKDFTGKLIMNRVDNGSTVQTERYHDTYYVYDNKELLNWVISPEGSYTITLHIIYGLTTAR